MLNRRTKRNLHRGIYFAKYYGQEKNEKWGSEEQNEKEGKRGKEKEEKERGRVIFLLIYGTLLLIIVY